MIDGAIADVAALRFAGIAGVSPRRLTCADLFEMAYGRQRHARQLALQQAAIQAREEPIDVQAWVSTGHLRDYYTQTIADPDLAQAVAEQLEAIKRTGTIVVKEADGKAT